MERENLTLQPFQVVSSQERGDRVFAVFISGKKSWILGDERDGAIRPEG
jgi:hypothetical protein